MQSIGKLLTNAVSKSSPSDKKFKAQSHRFRVRKSLCGQSNEKKDVIHAFGILGVGTLSVPNSDIIMTADFAAWSFLISVMQGYNSDRSTWQTIRPINHLSPGSSVIFGDTGSERLVLPHPRLESDCDPTISATDFAVHCLLSLQLMALKVKRCEKLVLVLIGHGYCEDLNCENSTFQLLLTTQADEAVSEASITKFQLEAAVKPCQGDILVICNSRFSNFLMSDRWTLLCSADPEHAANVLSGSHLGHVTGSVLTTRTVAQIARDPGQPVDIPRDAPPWTSTPPYCFDPISVHEATAIKSSSVSFEDFVSAMLKTEKLLIERASREVPINGPKAMATWTDIHQFTRRIGVKTDSSDYLTIYKQMCDINFLEEQLSPAILYKSIRFDPRLLKLATAMPDTGYIPRTPKIAYAKSCEELRRHISDPERYAFPPRTDSLQGETLLFMLHCYHFQDLAVQFIARELGWCDAACKVEVFLPQKFDRERQGFGDMIESGVKLDELPWYLKTNHFPRMRPELDENCAQWLSARWDAAGRPSIPRCEWDELVKKVGVLTEMEAI